MIHCVYTATWYLCLWSHPKINTQHDATTEPFRNVLQWLCLWPNCWSYSARLIIATATAPIHYLHERFQAIKRITCPTVSLEHTLLSQPHRPIVSFSWNLCTAPCEVAHCWLIKNEPQFPHKLPCNLFFLFSYVYHRLCPHCLKMHERP